MLVDYESMTKSKSSIYMLLLVCFVGQTVASCTDPVLSKVCSMCNSTTAACVSDKPEKLIPHTLELSIRTLFLYYNGSEPMTLKANMFSRYQQLKNISFWGNIKYLENRVFADRPALQKVSIEFSPLQDIPGDTFGEESGVKYLYLSNNDLGRIPSHVFHSLGDLELLELSYNTRILMCSNQTTIGEEFRKLPKLDILHIEGLGELGTELACQNISADYFEPVAQVRQLNLSETGFFSSNQSILTPLTNLTMLSLNCISPFRECPAKAEKLFNNLSEKLEILQARGWRTTSAVNSSCIANNKTLNGLKQLPNLKILDFKYSDMIFGSKVNRTIFQGFHHLLHLELSWCRISEFEEGALEGLFNLKTLKLKGNPVSSREFWVFGKNSTDSYGLEALKLKRCAIEADETFRYNAAYLIQSFPILKSLDLSLNLLFKLPHFAQPGLPQPTSSIEWLDLSGNQLAYLSGDDVMMICKVMPKLRTLKANDNHIANISGLSACGSLEELHIMNNHLGTHQEESYREIHKLSNLQYLDLSNNSLHYIPNRLFSRMKNLTILYLSKNQFTTIEDGTFFYNRHLSVIDFSINELKGFDFKLLYNATEVTELRLADNLITTVSSKNLTIMEQRLQSLKWITLNGNPFDCSCGKLYFQKWANDTTLIVKGLKEKPLVCATPQEQENEHLSSYKESYFTCHVQLPLMILCEVIGACLVSVSIGVACYRYRWYIKHVRVVFHALSDRAKDIKYMDECIYDAMICFDSKSNADAEWVVQNLLVKLEGGVYDQPINLESPDDRKCIVYVHERDSKIGPNRFDTLCDAMRQSRKIIVVLSNSALESRECMSEAVFAGQELFGTVTYKPEKIMVIVLEELDEDKLLNSSAASLLTETVIDLHKRVRRNERRMVPVWKRINKFVENRPRDLVYRRAPRRNGYQPI